jgi:hypothetical protein
MNRIDTLVRRIAEVRRGLIRCSLASGLRIMHDLLLALQYAPDCHNATKEARDGLD